MGRFGKRPPRTLAEGRAEAELTQAELTRARGDFSGGEFSRGEFSGDEFSLFEDIRDQLEAPEVEPIRLASSERELAHQASEGVL